MKTERLIAIIMLLMESDKIRASKLANMFEVTKRTIYGVPPPERLFTLIRNKSHN